MQGDCISSKFPTVPFVSKQFRNGEPPYPSSQYPPKKKNETIFSKRNQC